MDFQANFCKQLLVRKSKFPETCDSVLGGGYRPLRHPSEIVSMVFATIEQRLFGFFKHLLNGMRPLTDCFQLCHAVSWYNKSFRVKEHDRARDGSFN